MPWYPDAIKVDIGRGLARHTPVRAVCHTAVTNATELRPGQDGNFWHFYIGPTGQVHQYVDTDFRAGAEKFPGSIGSISFESWDGYREDAQRRILPLDAHGVTGWRHTTDVPAWTDAQVDAIIRWLRWLWDAHPSIPRSLATTSRDNPTSHGLAWHRLGVKLRPDDPTSQTGGVVWSSSAGKVCPGDRRIAQIPGILTEALTKDDDMDIQQLIDFRIDGRNLWDSLKDIHAMATHSRDVAVDSAARVAGLAAELDSIVGALGGGGAVDLGAIRAAARQGVADALSASVPTG